MKIGHGLRMTAACLIALAACKKSDTTTGGTGGSSTGTSTGGSSTGTSTGGSGTSTAGKAAGTGGSSTSTAGTSAGTGGKAAGTGGSGASGSGTSGSGAAGAPAVGSKAVATITAFGTGTVHVTGTATFTQGDGGSVTVVVKLDGCVDGKMYPVHIHDGTSCESAMTQGAHWGPTRGEGMPKVVCSGTSGTAMLTRPPTDPTLAWTVGGDAATNVIGHAFVAHDPDPVDAGVTPARIGCGVITKQ
jgi:hypothetical protein